MSAGDFPPEILVEVLHRLPVKSLVKFTSVSKAWNSLITNQTFIFDHLNRTIQASNGNGSLFLQLHHQTIECSDPYFDHHEEFYSLDSDNQQIDHFSVERFPLSRLIVWGRSTVVGSCDGLICVFDSSLCHSDTLIIWNPSIRKYMVLPEPIVTCMTGNNPLLFGFGFDSRNKDYKVIRIFPQVEVYSLASRSWKNITNRAPPFLHCKPPQKTTQVFVNGVVHWVVCRRCNGQIQNFILTFDVVEEMFGELMLPPHLRESTSVLSVLEGGKYLSVLHSHSEANQGCFRIWIMREYGVVETWSELFCFDSDHYRNNILDVLALASNGKVVLSLRKGTIVLFDPTTELLNPLGDGKHFRAFIGSYVQSLVLIKEEPHFLSY
ncbi:hypothetical protein QN277_010642 [Acacia crassicarpa]|uniref:F-box domain-containing protein n=1 Tax=Acacia crassicarpa TaxID=499986 RepID=A0AAE1IQ49_9FABA|nr:hypothetical protein QN277_010642 [Acacia crassicarpa]